MNCRAYNSYIAFQAHQVYVTRMVAIVLFQPDIPQNLGACLRLSACMGTPVHVVEPCGFPMNDQKLRRSGMDYMQHATLVRHQSWAAFCEYRSRRQGRLILIETDGSTRYDQFTYAASDYLVFGRESAGTPRELYPQMQHQLTIPMREGVRSLNIAMAAGIVVAEACRQQGFAFA
jgi:tRNA (cytidine/uridine-2'-O-)-methyltransferase